MGEYMASLPRLAMRSQNGFVNLSRCRRYPRMKVRQYYRITLGLFNAHNPNKTAKSNFL
jgi:hypothetical protein